MGELFRETVDALVGYLEELKRQGSRYITVSPETLQALDQPVARPSARSRPAATASSAAPATAPEKPAMRSSIPKPAPATRTAVMPAATPPAVTEPARVQSAATTDQDRAAAMAALRERALACQKCPHLVRSRKNVVFGVGDIYSPLMFVGEAPGADEDEQGEPFVGRAGQLLTRIIETMGLTRETVYIANILKCRPDTPGQSAGNRKPTTDEMKTCLPYLLAQIDLIQPRVIVALGATAVEGLFGGPVQITKMRGHFRRFRDIPVMPTYHPSYLLRNQALATKREVWEDMLQILEFLQLPISEKQRGYFLKSS